MQAAATTWNTFDAATSRWYTRLMPSLTDIAFLLPAGLLFSKMSGTKTLFADGDTGWHIRTGEWILQHGAVPTYDFFSYTKPHQPWFAWEWGWDLLFAIIHRTWGLGGVGFVNVLLLGVISVMLYRLVVGACGNYVLGFAVTAFALCGSTIHWLARPHLFSWLFFLCYLHLLPDVQRGSRRALFLLPALMILWVNTHGAFFIGIVLLLATACGEAVEALILHGETWRAVYGRCRFLLMCSATCFLATFVNPYTWRLHQHVVAFLSNAKLLDNIQEYQSISFHCGPAIFFEVTIVLAVGSAFWCLQSGKVTPALMLVMWTHLALLSARNIPLFMMIAAPIVAVGARQMLSKLKPMHYIGGVLTTVSEICEELKPLERAPRVHLASGLAVLLMAALFASGAKGFEAQFNPESFPAQAIPLIERSAAKRIFTYDQWADYLIYRLYPLKPVFMDGRSDFFGNEFVTATQHIIGAQYDWKTKLTQFAVDMVIVKPDAPVAAVLKMSPEWKMLFDDGKVLVFEAAPSRTPSSDVQQRRERLVR